MNNGHENPVGSINGIVSMILPLQPFVREKEITTTKTRLILLMITHNLG
jgi:hypothetical protein